MASISVVAGDELSTKAATAQAARDLDQVQYDLQEGPCVDALLDPGKAEFIVDDMDPEQRWAKCAPAAARLGVRSLTTRSLPGSASVKPSGSSCAPTPSPTEPHSTTSYGFGSTSIPSSDVATGVVAP